MKFQSTRRLGMESLETRDLMAGNVTASVVNQNLVIRGDDQANVVTITQTANNTFLIAGTGTTINGQASVSLSATGEMSINLAAGNDKLKIGGGAGLLTLPGNLTVNMGSGADRLGLLRVKGIDAAISMGLTAEDEVDDLNLTRVAFDGTVNAKTGGGADRVVLSTAQVTTYLKLDTGSGRDVAEMANITTGKMALLFGTDNDRLTFSGLNTFTQKIAADGGDGTDRVDEIGGTSYVVSVPNPLFLNFETDLLSI